MIDVENRLCKGRIARAHRARAASAGRSRGCRAPVAGSGRPMTMTRSDRKTASSMLWVTKTTVLRVDCQMDCRSICRLRARQRVERSERLVHEQKRRVVNERAANRHPLAHSARQLPRIFPFEVGEPHRADQGAEPARGAARSSGRAFSNWIRTLPSTVRQSSNRIALEHDAGVGIGREDRLAFDAGLAAGRLDQTRR